MSDVQEVKKLAHDVLEHASQYYHLQRTYQNEQFRTVCERGLYEFLKYCYGGTLPA